MATTNRQPAPAGAAQKSKKGPAGLRLLRRQRRAAQQGGILVQTVVVLAGLTALMATVAADQRASLQAVQQKLRERRCEVAAKAAIARALVAVSAANTNVVTLNDDWAALGKNGDTLYDLGDGSSFRVQIIDTNSLIDVNQAATTQLQALPLSMDQIDCLLDWRSTGTNPRPDGAKDEYYTELSTPYNTKLGSLTTLDELLLVKGWTAYGLYTPGAEASASTGSVQTTSTVTQVTLEDTNNNPLPLIDVLTVDSGMPNKTASGGNRTNVNTNRLNANVFERWGLSNNAATQLANGGPYTTLRNLLTRPGVNNNVAQQILNSATVSNGIRLQGKLNLNTATLSVLETVPNMTPDIAQSIITLQQGTGFPTLSTLATVPGVSGQTLAQLADAFGIGSDTFLVRAYGMSGGVGAAYEIVIGVRTSNNVPITRVLTWKRLSGTAVPYWWDWSNGTTDTQDATALQPGTSTTVSTTGGAQ